MNPIITQALQNSERAFDEQFTEVIRENPRIVQKPDPRIKSFIHQSNLELLAAVRDFIRDFEPERRMWSLAKEELTTALSEGKENV